jgi:pilus assembly protein CpaB
MGAVRIIVLAVAAVAAIGLALMVRHMASGSRPAPVAVAAPAAVEKPMAQVLVARRDLAVGTRIHAGDVGWQPWPIDSLNASFITDGSAAVPTAPAPKSVAGKAAKTVEKVAASVISGDPARALDGAVVREPILSGEPVTERKIVRGGEGGFMAVVLQPGMRAMALPVTVETGAGGFILPGDRVDVLQNRRVEAAGGGSANQETVSTVIMRNLRVLAIDQTTDAEKNAKSVVGATATLEVPAGDETVVAKAKSQGDLVLALRSYADAGGPAGRGVGGENTRVRVWRAGQASEVTVAQ